MNKLEKLADWPALLLITGIFLFTGLGDYGLLETSETRYAEISWEMTRSGDWVTPRYNFIKHFHKPPLIYWSTGISMKVFGETEFATRFPQALFGLAGILATFFIAGTLFDRLTGFLAGLVLLSSLEYFFLSRYLVTDMLLTFFILCSIFFYCNGLEKPWNWRLFFISLSGAMLTKGPVGILLVALIIVVDLIFAKRGKEFFKIGWGKGLLLTLALSLPWFALLCIQNPGLLNYFVFFHTIDRFFTTTHGRMGSYFYFIPVFLIGLLPWTLLLPDLIIKYFTSKNNARGNSRFLVIWILVPLVFFSFSGSKLVNYLLPIFPAASIWVGKMWRDILLERENGETQVKISIYLCIFSFLALAIAFTVFFLWTDTFSRFAEYDLAAMKNSSVYLALLSFSGGILVWRFYKSGAVRFFFPTLLFISLFSYMVLVKSISSIEPLLSPTTLFVKIISETFKPGDRIANYKCMLNGLPFYTGKRIITFVHKRETQFEENQEEVDRYVVKDKRRLKEFVKSEAGLYVVVKKRHFQEAIRMAGRPLRVLARTPSYMLLTNKKNHKE